MKNKILVTGASGNVGKEVVKQLQKAEVQIVAAALDKNDAQLIPEGKNTEIVFLDFGKPESFPGIFSGITKMFLMRPPHISDVESYIFPVIDAAKHVGVQLISFLSLMGIEQNRWAPHYAVEKYLKDSGVPYIFIRPSFYMQNFTGTHAVDIKMLDEILLPAGKGKNSFIDVRDIGAVVAKTLVEEGHANKAYTLTGAEALNYSQAADIFSQVLGRNILYKNPSPFRFHRHMKKQHAMNAKFIWIMQILYLTVRLGRGALITDTVFQLLERQPISLRQFVEDHQEIWKG